MFFRNIGQRTSMNKYKTKLIAKKSGLVIAKDMVVGKNINRKNCEKLNLPIVVKPIELGSSVGINIAKTGEELKKLYR